MKRIKTIAIGLLAAVMLLAGSVSAFAETKVYSTATPDEWMPQKYTGFAYKHSPLHNAKAMEDIIVNENAIYGYSPNPESKRLGEYASYDWSDPSVVWKARQDRIKYLEQDKGLYNMILTLRAQGKDTEEIARTVSDWRNKLRLQAYEGDTEGLAKVKASNLKTYGNEEGPTADSLYEKYGSWETVMQKVLSSNPGMDACLGLYDDNYYTYVINGYVNKLDEISDAELLKKRAEANTYASLLLRNVKRIDGQ